MAEQLPFKIYLVGGAVRDQLLGRQVNERDWVVVGATVEQLLEHGFQPVGKDFPVFLHPQTNEEYALARTERKISRGYSGFAFDADPSVTLEDDLLRRDLTINAIAQKDDGTLIDPYNGQADIKAKVLRHVSEAFAEDPVRILRIARFAARFNDFTIHPKTMALMKRMVADGEVDALVAERVWKECSRALVEAAPKRFFSTLAESGALGRLFPELRYPEAMSTLERSAELSGDGAVRFASMLYDIPNDAIQVLCKRLRTPTDYKDLACHVANHYQKLIDLSLFDARAIVDLLNQIDAFRRPGRVRPIVLATQAIHPNLDPRLLPTLDAAVQTGLSVDAQVFVEQGLKNAAIGQAVTEARIQKVAKLIEAL